MNATLQNASFDPIGADCRRMSATAFSVAGTLANLEPGRYHNLREWFQRSIVECADRIIAARSREAAQGIAARTAQAQECDCTDFHYCANCVARDALRLQGGAL